MTTSPNGDLEQLYREHIGRLWRLLLAFTGDPEAASDAVAEAFAQALRRRTEIRDPERWVWRAAFRIAAGQLKERRQEWSEVEEQSYEMPEPADEIVAALRRLSPSQRAAVVLHHYAGYPVREVARVLDSTSAAVRVHLSQGRRRLRARLEATRDA